MADVTRRHGTHPVAHEAIPEEVDDIEEKSVGTRAYYIERDVRDINRRLKEGDRQLANLRTADENNAQALYALERELSKKLEEVRRELEGRDITNRRELELTVTTGDANIELEIGKLRDEVAPRVTIWRILGWIAVIVVPTAIALGGWLWSASKYPDRDEFKELQTKVQTLSDSVIKLETKQRP